MQLDAFVYELSQYCEVNSLSIFCIPICARKLVQLREIVMLHFTELFISANHALCH